jgi:hypothetical protein
MDVILDSASNYTMEGDPQDVFSAVGAISEYLRREGRSILSVRVDGTEIAPEELTTRLKDTPTSGVSQLEIGTEQTAKLVEECLQGLGEYLPELPNICRSLAEVFQGENPDEGFEPFVKTAELWGQIKSREALVANALELDTNALAINDKSIDIIHSELNQFLEEAAQALKDGDTILLGDLLEYELAPRAEQEIEIVALLQAQIPASPG